MSLSEAYSASSRGFIQNFGRSRVSPGPASYVVQREWMKIWLPSLARALGVSGVLAGIFFWLRREIARKSLASRPRRRSGWPMFLLRL